MSPTIEKIAPPLPLVRSHREDIPMRGYIITIMLESKYSEDQVVEAMQFIVNHSNDLSIKTKRINSENDPRVEILFLLNEDLPEGHYLGNYIDYDRIINFYNRDYAHWAQLFDH